MSILAITPTVGPPELVVILVIVVLLFGARKLPELGSSVGRSIKNFKQGLRDGDEEEGPTAEDESGQADEGTRADVPAGSPQERS